MYFLFLFSSLPCSISNTFFFSFFFLFFWLLVLTAAEVSPITQYYMLFQYQAHSTLERSYFTSDEISVYRVGGWEGKEERLCIHSYKELGLPLG